MLDLTGKYYSTLNGGVKLLMNQILNKFNLTNEGSKLAQFSSPKLSYTTTYTLNLKLTQVIYFTILSPEYYSDKTAGVQNLEFLRLIPFLNLFILYPVY